MPSIDFKNTVKCFDSQRALDGLTLHVDSGSVCGLVGPNGAGKTTAIRHLCGVLRQDSGEVLINEEPIWENTALKSRLFCIPDEVFYFPTDDSRDLMRFLRSFYPQFDDALYTRLGEAFPIDPSCPIRRLSRGMQKQAIFRLALSCRPELLILDEPVDGLDPVMRRQVWSLILSSVAESGTTVLVSSHNLRELEDVCDHVAIMDKGRCLMQRSLSELQDNICKILVALPDGVSLPEELDLLHSSVTGHLHTLILHGDAAELTARLAALSPQYMDVLPLSLEEIFIYELGGADYAVADIVL